MTEDLEAAPADDDPILDVATLLVRLRQAAAQLPLDAAPRAVP